MSINLKTVLLIIILIFALIPLSVSASSESLKTEVTATVSPASIIFNIRITNLSNNTLKNFLPRLFFQGEELFLNKRTEFKPGEFVQQNLHYANKGLTPGTYHFPLTISYEDPNGLIKQALTINTLSQGTPPDPGVTVVVENIHIQAGETSNFPILVINHDEVEKEITFHTLSPLIQNTAPISDRVPPNSRKIINLPIIGVNTEIELNSGISTIISFFENGFQHSQHISSNIILTPTQSLLQIIFGSPRTLVIVLISFLLVLVILRFTRRILNQKKNIQ